MWNVAILVIMMAVAGGYMTHSLQVSDQLQSQVAMSLASEMAIYRDAVISYFTENNLLSTSVSFAALTSSGALPAWTTMAQSGSAPIWNNYRDADGVIYIYASTLPAQNIAGQLVVFSHESILVGVYRTTLSTLQSPLFGDTNIPLTALSGKSVPDGAPVWIAMTK